MCARHHDPSLVKGRRNLLHVLDNGVIRGVGVFLEFVLVLVENHRSTLGDLVVGDDLANLLDPRVPFGVVFRVAGAFGPHLAIGCPEGEPPRGGFGVDVGTGASNHVQTGLFGVVEDALDIVGTMFKVKSVFRRRVEAPEEVDYCSWNEGISIRRNQLESASLLMKREKTEGRKERKKERKKNSRDTALNPFALSF